jgi:hypothetical protein
MSQNNEQNLVLYSHTVRYFHAYPTAPKDGFFFIEGLLQIGKSAPTAIPVAWINNFRNQLQLEVFPLKHSRPYNTNHVLKSLNSSMATSFDSLDEALERLHKILQDKAAHKMLTREKWMSHQKRRYEKTHFACMDVAMASKPEPPTDLLLNLLADRREYTPAQRSLLLTKGEDSALPQTRSDNKEKARTTGSIWADIQKREPTYWTTRLVRAYAMEAPLLVTHPGVAKVPHYEVNVQNRLHPKALDNFKKRLEAMLDLSHKIPFAPPKYAASNLRLPVGHPLNVWRVHNNPPLTNMTMHSLVELPHEKFLELLCLQANWMTDWMILFHSAVGTAARDRILAYSSLWVSTGQTISETKVDNDYIQTLINEVLKSPEFLEQHAPSEIDVSTLPSLSKQVVQDLPPRKPIAPDMEEDPEDPLGVYQQVDVQDYEQLPHRQNPGKAKPIDLSGIDLTAPVNKK